MAINKTINKRTNTHGAMRNCIEYVLRQDKTSEQLTYVTGPYCHDEINYDLVYRAFLEEKKMWDKDTWKNVRPQYYFLAQGRADHPGASI